MGPDLAVEPDDGVEGRRAGEIDGERAGGRWVEREPHRARRGEAGGRLVVVGRRVRQVDRVREGKARHRDGIVEPSALQRLQSCHRVASPRRWKAHAVVSRQRFANRGLVSARAGW